MNVDAPHCGARARWSKMAMSLVRRWIQPHYPGLVYSAVLVLIALAAMNNQNNLLFWLFGILFSGLFVSALLTAVMMWSLRVRRLDPQHGSIGEPLIVRYAVTNRSRFLPAFNIQVQDVPPGRAAADSWQRLMEPARAWVMHAGLSETVHGEAVFWPTQRGEVVFDRIRFSTTFPFGIVSKSITLSQPQHTLIYPMLYELRRGVLASLAPTGFLGAKVTQHPGAGDDYYGIREFRPGDSMRHIAWKRTAQLDQLVALERAAPSPAKLRVILDLTTPTDQLRLEPATPTAARDAEERAISLTASIIHAAEIDGFEIGLTVLGLDVPEIAVRRDRWHVRKMMAALAAIDLDSSRLRATPLPVREAERAALVVISPDRVQPLPGRDSAWYLTARQLDELAVRPIGWDPSKTTVDPVPAPSRSPSNAPRRSSLPSRGAVA